MKKQALKALLTIVLVVSLFCPVLAFGETKTKSEIPVLSETQIIQILEWERQMFSSQELLRTMQERFAEEQKKFQDAQLARQKFIDEITQNGKYVLDENNWKLIPKDSPNK